MLNIFPNGKSTSNLMSAACWFLYISRCLYFNSRTWEQSSIFTKSVGSQNTFERIQIKINTSISNIWIQLTFMLPYLYLLNQQGIFISELELHWLSIKENLLKITNAKSELTIMGWVVWGFMTIRDNRELYFVSLQWRPIVRHGYAYLKIKIYIHFFCFLNIYLMETNTHSTKLARYVSLFSKKVFICKLIG